MAVRRDGPTFLRGGVRGRPARRPYRFRGEGGEYVSLADVTYEPYLSSLIAFDAVRWSPRLTVALCGQ